MAATTTGVCEVCSGSGRDLYDNRTGRPLHVALCRGCLGEVARVWEYRHGGTIWRSFHCRSCVRHLDPDKTIERYYCSDACAAAARQKEARRQVFLELGRRLGLPG